MRYFLSSEYLADVHDNSNKSQNVFQSNWLASHTATATPWKQRQQTTPKRNTRTTQEIEKVWGGKYLKGRVAEKWRGGGVEWEQKDCRMFLFVFICRWARLSEAKMLSRVFLPQLDLKSTTAGRRQSFDVGRPSMLHEGVSYRGR